MDVSNSTEELIFFFGKLFGKKLLEEEYNVYCNEQREIYEREKVGKKGRYINGMVSLNR